MKASFITIGDELLIGQTVDTNSAWMGAEMSSLGFDVCRITSIHDRKEDIVEALDAASSISDIVLITGGLGPTSDDITKQTLCEYFNTRLVGNPVVLGMITAMLERREMALNEYNRRQAEVPESCTVLTNAAGTAPGMWFEKDGTIFVSMPGVPHEMKYIMTEHVLPMLNKRFSSQVIVHRNIMTYGSFEAQLSELLSNFESELPAPVKLAYLPASGVIKLRLTGTGTNGDEIRKLTEQQVNKLYSIIPQYIYGENEEALELVTGRLLKERNKTVCTAESCTGGKIANLLTSVPGSSAYYKGSVVAYSNSVKTSILGVSPVTITENGAVSREVVEAMAEGAMKLMDTDYSIAVTGIAGPDGGTPGKPVGTVWMAVASHGGVISQRKVFTTDRYSNIMRASLAAINLLRLQIINK